MTFATSVWACMPVARSTSSSRRWRERHPTAETTRPRTRAAGSTPRTSEALAPSAAPGTSCSWRSRSSTAIRSLRPSCRSSASPLSARHARSRSGDLWVALAAAAAATCAHPKRAGSRLLRADIGRGDGPIEYVTIGGYGRLFSSYALGSDLAVQDRAIGGEAAKMFHATNNHGTRAPPPTRLLVRSPCARVSLNARVVLC